MKLSLWCVGASVLAIAVAGVAPEISAPPPDIDGPSARVALRPIAALIGVPLIDGAGREVAQATDVWIDPRDGGVERVIVVGAGALEGGRAIAADDVRFHEHRGVLWARTDRTLADLAVAPSVASARRSQRELDALISARALSGATVASGDDRLGSIDQVVVDLRRNALVYVVVGRDGFFGVGRERRALPASLLRLRRVGEGAEARSTLARDAFEAGPLLAEGSADLAQQASWLRELCAFHSVEPYGAASNAEWLDEAALPSSKPR